MPYIKQEQRDILDGSIGHLLDQLRTLGTDPGHLAGPLNYCLTRLVHGVIDHTTGGKLRYDVLALMSGVVSNVGDELYRRVAAPYEDEKINQNGDLPGREEFNEAPTLVVEAPETD
jgi:hypothetical protein